MDPSTRAGALTLGHLAFRTADLALEIFRERQVVLQLLFQPVTHLAHLLRGKAAEGGFDFLDGTHVSRLVDGTGDSTVEMEERPARVVGIMSG